jgi:hypothetical protein
MRLKLRLPSVAFAASKEMTRELFELGADWDGVSVYLYCIHLLDVELAATETLANTSLVRLDFKLTRKLPL